MPFLEHKDHHMMKNSDGLQPTSNGTSLPNRNKPINVSTRAKRSCNEHQVFDLSKLEISEAFYFTHIGSNALKHYQSLNRTQYAGKPTMSLESAKHHVVQLCFGQSLCFFLRQLCSLLGSCNPMDGMTCKGCLNDRTVNLYDPDWVET